MDKTQAAPFRQQLLAQQSELLAQLAAQRRASSAAPRPLPTTLVSPRTRVPNSPPSGNLSLRWTNAKPPTLPPWKPLWPASKRARTANAQTVAPTSPPHACTQPPRPHAACIARKRPNNTAVLREFAHAFRPLFPFFPRFFHHFKKADS